MTFSSADCDINRRRSGTRAHPQSESGRSPVAEQHDREPTAFVRPRNLRPRGYCTPECQRGYRSQVCALSVRRSPAVVPSGGFGAQLARIGRGSPSLTTPAGAPGFNPRVSFGVSRSNFLGLGHTISFQGRLSSIQTRALVNYMAPQFKGNDRLNLTVTALYDDSRDIATFNARRQEAAIQLAQRVTKATTIQYRVAYRRASRKRVEDQSGAHPAFCPEHPTWERFNDIYSGSSRRPHGSAPGHLQYAGCHLCVQSFRRQHNVHSSARPQRDIPPADARSRSGAIDQPRRNRPNQRRRCSFAGAILRRRRHLASRLQRKSGWSTRPFDGVSDRRQGSADQSIQSFASR